MTYNILISLTILILLRGISRGSPISSSPHAQEVARHTKADEMLKYMNATVDPCEDFYEYTCGNYAKYNAADADEPSMGPLESLSRAMDEKMILELQVDNATDTDWDRMVKNFYRSCIAAPELSSVYPKKLKELIKEFGQMPALVGESWHNTDFDWLETVANIARIIGAHIALDFVNNTKNAEILASPTLSLEQKSFYVNEKFKKVHHMFIDLIAENMHAFLGMDMDVASQTAKEIFEFEVALARGLADDKDSSQLLEKYIPTKSEDLHKKYSHVWDTNKLFTTAFGSVPSHVYVEHKYMEHVKEVLNKTSNRVIANYVFYTYAKYFTYEPQETQKEIEQMCLTTTKKYFYKNLDNLMYRRLFTEQMKEGVYSIWQDIKATFQDVLQSPRMAWIRSDTRKNAVAKLQHMKMQINSYEDFDFAKEFKGLRMQPNDFVENMKSVLGLLGDKARAEADKPPQPFEAGSDSTFTPLYLTVENRVFVPVSFLMPYQFWSISYPHAYNFASLGFYLAHELLHGFDDGGRLFDDEGNSRNWWDTKSVGEFEKRKTCFVKQYSNFIYNESPLGELQAQGENIADNGGVRLAFEAYLKWYTKATEAKHKMDMESLPGFNYSHRQLFFISYGQTWCNDVSKIVQLIQSMTDTHTPDRYRVTGPLSNLEEFANEFNCPKGSAMNPEVKCELY